MSSGLTETTTIETNIALASEWEGQLLRLSMQKRLLHKYQANEIAAVHAKYAPEKEAIKNKINALDDKKTTNEYHELMTELQEIDSKENMEVNQIESITSDQEEGLQLQMDNLESRLEACKKDTESLKETRKSNQESSFGYFKT